MASSTPSLGQGLLLFCELYAGALLAIALSCAGFLIAVKRREARQQRDAPEAAS